MSSSGRARINHTIAIFEAARKPLFTVLDGIAQDDLDWNPAPGARGIGKICRHMYRVDIWFLKRLGIEPAITHDAPGTAGEIAGRMRTIQEQVIAEVDRCADDAELMGERTSLDGETGARMGVNVVHMAQHYLYHLAQMTYLRRIREREWTAPLDQWDHATHVIGDRILE